MTSTFDTEIVVDGQDYGFRDAFVANGMDHGVREDYERLDVVLGAIAY